MQFRLKTGVIASAVLLGCFSSVSAANAPQAAHIEFGAAHAKSGLKQAPRPHARQSLPPSLEQIKFNLPESSKPRTDLFGNAKVKGQSLANATAVPADCQDMNKLATYSGAALADYIVSLPSYECHYGLFSMNATLAAKVFSAANMDAVARRFATEAASYNATNIKLVNLLIYLRAGYYQASGYSIPAPSNGVRDTLRGALAPLVVNANLFKENISGTSTANETMLLITNMNDEPYYLPQMKTLVQRYTNSGSNPNAAAPLLGNTAGRGFTGVLTVFFYAHYRSAADNIVQNDVSYPQTLYNFVSANKAALLGSGAAYQLSDAEREAFRFMQYAAQKPNVKPLVKNALATSTMLGNDGALWLEAASAVDYYDAANCAEYGTCNYKGKLADNVLKNSYTCSPTLKIRAQEMTVAQMQESCNILAAEETYFHQMLKTNKKPVANDNNSSLELVVFDDYTNYDKYAGIIYDIDTNNGGMYLEGDPSRVGNQARFIAHEASWLRPTFKVWNLEHEYVHYLDGRFDMHGDFGAGTTKPTVWWIEGIAEYLSLRNDNQKSIDVAKSGKYPLSTIFGNTYSMSDYTDRAYRWGYMAARFMNEKHRSDIDAVVAKFRVGDYEGYQRYMDVIGNRYDAEFASWVQTATTAGQPPMPGEDNLPPCPRNDQLGKNCSISGYASNYAAYSYIMLPAGAKNLRLYTTGGTGNVDLWVGEEHYPSKTSGDPRSTNAGNNESVLIPNPVTGRWIYIMLDAKQPFSGVTLNASYE